MSKKTIISIIIAVLVVALVTGVVYGCRKKQRKATEQSVVTTERPTTQSTMPESSVGPAKKEPSSLEIEVISPNGGEKWKRGTVQEIKWRFSSEMERKIDTKEIISLSIDINSEAGFWHIHREDNLGENFTSMKWKVGDAGPMPGGFGQTPFYEEHPKPIPNKQYKIRVCGSTSETFYEICDESNASFLIVGEGD